MNLNPYDFSHCKSHKEIDETLYRRLAWLAFAVSLFFFICACTGHL